MFESKAPQHFSGAEIDLAVRKLKFLFRILLLHDINAEIEDGEVDRVCRNIDKWYEKNTLSWLMIKRKVKPMTFLLVKNDMVSIKLSPTPIFSGVKFLL